MFGNTSRLITIGYALHCIFLCIRINLLCFTPNLRGGAIAKKGVIMLARYQLSNLPSNSQIDLLPISQNNAFIV
jgi:hypothetical protein